jgi:predicted Zn-dependent protease with MMP-like domain
VDIESFTALADQMVERIPPRFLDGLNGGIVIVEEPFRNATDPPDLYILGHYIDDFAMGRYIALYYGSFVQLFRDEPRQVWEEELWETILHELRHHVERQAGIGDLDLEDELELERLRQEAAGPPRRFKPNRRLRPR